jgi:Restriction endonuclease S subunits
MSNEINIMKLSDLCTTVKKGLSSYYLKNKDEEGTDMSVVNIKDVHEGYIDTSTVDRINVHVTDAVENAKIKHGDLLISTKGSNLRVAVADTSIEGFVFSANLTVLTLADNIDPEIVAAYLNCPHGQQELNKRVGGSSVKTLNTRQLLEVPIPVPTLETQQELSHLLKNIRECTLSLAKEATAWKQIADEALIKTLDV